MLLGDITVTLLNKSLNGNSLISSIGSLNLSNNALLRLIKASIL